jgi:hypothetical protein
MRSVASRRGATRTDGLDEAKDHRHPRNRLPMMAHNIKATIAVET